MSKQLSSNSPAIFQQFPGNSPRPRVRTRARGDRRQETGDRKRELVETFVCPFRLSDAREKRQRKTGDSSTPRDTQRGTDQEP